MFSYNPGFQSIVRGVRKLRQGFRLVADSDRDHLAAYFRLSFESPLEQDATEIVLICTLN